MSATKPPGYDDRFVVPLEPSRRGAHRARMSPLVASLPIIAVVVVVVAAIVMAWALFGGSLLNHGTTVADNTVKGTSVPSGQSSANPGHSASTSAAPKTTAPKTTAPSASASSAPPAGGTVDKAITVTVLNPTGRSGLARRAATALQGKGWTKATASFNKTTLRPTTIYYATNADHATAQALQADLGVGQVLKSATKAGNGITVVLGNDYQP
jgi:cytoskeletal protein RodZ